MKIFSENKPVDQNPFVKGLSGRRQWNDRYLNLKHTIRHWQWAFFASISISVIFCIALSVVAMQTKIKPYIIETHDGEPYAIHGNSSKTISDEKIINFIVNQFITNSRTVLNDKDAQTSLIDKVYAYCADDATKYLKTYYEENNPIDDNKDYTIAINIINTLSLSKNTWQVSFDEIKRNKIDGSLVDTTHWLANLTWAQGAPNEKFLNDNPFGIYITKVNWSKNQNTLKRNVS